MLIHMMLLCLFGVPVVPGQHPSTTNRRIAAHTEPGDYISPDGKFVAHIAYEDAAPDLWISRVRPHRKSRQLRAALVKDIADVTGWLWVPHRPHTLIFAASGMYGKALLDLWHGGTRLVKLRRAKHPTDEAFELYSVSSDGRTIFYGHGGAAEYEENYKHFALRLPR